MEIVKGPQLTVGVLKLSRETKRVRDEKPLIVVSAYTWSRSLKCLGVCLGTPLGDDRKTWKRATARN